MARTRATGPVVAKIVDSGGDISPPCAPPRDVRYTPKKRGIEMVGKKKIRAGGLHRKDFRVIDAYLAVEVEAPGAVPSVSVARPR